MRLKDLLQDTKHVDQNFELTLSAQDGKFVYRGRLDDLEVDVVEGKIILLASLTRRKRVLGSTTNEAQSKEMNNLKHRPPPWGR